MLNQAAKDSSSCPCHSGLPYKSCCSDLHRELKPPADALALMRSRYSAFALQNADYIIKTTHTKNPAYIKSTACWRKEILSFSSRTEFLGLKVVSFEPAEDASFVTFTAFLKQGESDVSFSEKSRFEKERGKWKYLSGEIQAFLI